MNRLFRFMSGLRIQCIVIVNGVVSAQGENVRHNSQSCTFSVSFNLTSFIRVTQAMETQEVMPLTFNTIAHTAKYFIHCTQKYAQG